jgi:hypothetical protein
LVLDEPIDLPEGVVELVPVAESRDGGLVDAAEVLAELRAST